MIKGYDFVKGYLVTEDLTAQNLIETMATCTVS
ncbi:hypothetical protein N482_06920 [Pseudoalteromonas luteoviolacea NCIMB 1942]|uniref:Uncharacterized protein n=1 Tax=Pseudoalteromonas luteoviolacea NCIMB 1942 TaxID=1365253 RepID=A0A167DHZ9_9GAMM|nr:hypothetical protein N482_06920 [Pseudoalteromonas luteoviolacea NCIMB 1942]